MFWFPFLAFLRVRSIFGGNDPRTAVCVWGAGRKAEFWAHAKTYRWCRHSIGISSREVYRRTELLRSPSCFSAICGEIDRYNEKDWSKIRRSLWLWWWWDWTDCLVQGFPLIPLVLTEQIVSGATCVPERKMFASFQVQVLFSLWKRNTLHTLTTDDA